MKKLTPVLIAALAFSLGSMSAFAQFAPTATKHTFALGTTDFLLDGKPFQIRSGEMHPQRIPHEYWRQRIAMDKAMGMNTVAIYVMWNEIEQPDGSYDFKTGNNDIAEFLKIAQEEGMWVMLRPGPYVCGEWDFGGLPVSFLKDPTIKIRTTNPKYMAAVTKYITALAAQIKPFLVTNGGPILMVQIENEFGSYGSVADHAYPEALRDLWHRLGVNVPNYTADGGSVGALKVGALKGAAVGLDPGTGEDGYKAAAEVNPGVPVFSAETYPGWLTHWRDPHFAGGNAVGQVKWLMDHKKSFNLYMFCGGTNFGFTAGANGNYQPDITSYDYGAPLTEQGRTTKQYMDLRNLIAGYLSKENPPQTLPPVPAVIPAMSLPAIQMQAFTSIWQHLPAPLTSPQPQTFEALNQNQGFMVYQTSLPNGQGGKLTFKDLHDFALVYVDAKFIGTVDRTLHNQDSITLPASQSLTPKLTVLVEGMGHVNFDHSMDHDTKGITHSASLNGNKLTNWTEYQLPMRSAWIAALQQTQPTTVNPEMHGLFFKGVFSLSRVADTYIDMSGYQKGFVWVNGHNLGRFWNVGPQQRLYCPAPWLKQGMNQILVFDLLQKTPASIDGKETLH